MPVLYRASLSSLSVARATSLDQRADRLSREPLHAGLLLRLRHAHPGVGPHRAVSSPTTGPRPPRPLWRETLVSAALTALGAVSGYLLVMRDPEWFSTFVPGGLAEGRGPEASTAALRATLFDTQHDQLLSVLATFLFTHNAGVALLAFALGFAFCLPTAFLLVVQRLRAGRLPRRLRSARAGLRGGRLADHPRRDRALRHHAGRRGRASASAGRWPSPASGPGSRRSAQPAGRRRC